MITVIPLQNRKESDAGHEQALQRLQTIEVQHSKDQESLEDSLKNKKGLFAKFLSETTLLCKEKEMEQENKDVEKEIQELEDMRQDSSQKFHQTLQPMEEHYQSIIDQFESQEAAEEKTEQAVMDDLLQKILQELHDSQQEMDTLMSLRDQLRHESLTHAIEIEQQLRQEMIESERNDMIEQVRLDTLIKQIKKNHLREVKQLDYDFKQRVLKLDSLMKTTTNEIRGLHQFIDRGITARNTARDSPSTAVGPSKPKKHMTFDDIYLSQMDRKTVVKSPSPEPEVKEQVRKKLPTKIYLDFDDDLDF